LVLFLFWWWSTTTHHLTNKEGRPRKTTQQRSESICFAGGIIVGMFPFCLYFVASVITGFQVCTLLVRAAYGAPSNPLELVSLLGSLCLLIAAYLSLFKPHAAARLALIACLTIWCFYGPAIAKSVRTKLTGQSSVLAGPLLITHPEVLRAQATTVFAVAPDGGLPWSGVLRRTPGVSLKAK
jgi:hypothetical protein